MRAVLLTLLLAAVSLSSACFGGNVTFAVNHIESDGQALSPDLVEYFGVKITGVYLSVNEVVSDDNFILGSIYDNPECEGDSERCDAAASDEHEVAHVVESYFDFARPTDEVNAELSAQQMPVSATTYHYVNIEWCKWAEEAQTLRARSVNMPDGAFFETSFGSCRTQVEADPPIEVTPGASLQVQLNYDLSAMIQTEPLADGSCGGSYSHCYETDDTRYLLGVFEPVPSVVVLE